MINVSKGVYIKKDEIEAMYDDIIVMKDGVLIYVESQIEEVNKMS